jgi:hypothetical protein
MDDFSYTAYDSGCFCAHMQVARATMIFLLQNQSCSNCWGFFSSRIVQHMQA